jgi:hypothetical protein
MKGITMRAANNWRTDPWSIEEKCELDDMLDRNATQEEIRARFRDRSPYSISLYVNDYGKKLTRAAREKERANNV